jgi:hypothetical protein
VQRSRIFQNFSPFIGVSVVKTRFWFDRFPSKTLEWLSLPVPADPFWAARRG